MPTPASDEHDQLRRQTLTVEEAGRLLGIGRNSAYEAVRRGELYAIRLGKRLLVPRPVVERMLAGYDKPKP